MRVLKRDGSLEDVSFDKVLKRISMLSQGLSIDPSVLAQQVCGRIYDKIATTELDEFASSLSASMSLENLDYEILASRIIISNLHKNTLSDYALVVQEMLDFLDPSFVSFVMFNKDAINSMINYQRDFLFDYFGYKTLERGKYIFREGSTNKVIERPQHMLMRVAIGIHISDLTNENVLQSIQETYELLSCKLYTHATPTLFNAGSRRPQLSSCFLLDMQQDSIEGIYDTLKDCALISKEAGGIGLAVHKVRAKNSRICGTNGHSNGLVPMLKVFNETAKYVDQCLLPDTLIYTLEGPMEIQYCTSQETSVYNSEGTTETINNVLEFVYSGDLYHLYSNYCGQSIKVTSEHLIYVVRKPSLNATGESESIQKRARTCAEFCQLSSDIERQSLCFEYVEAKYVSVGDFLVFKAPVFFQELTNITEADCYFYGCLLAAGDIDNSDLDNVFQGYIDIQKSNTEMRNEIIRYFEEKCILYAECDYSADINRVVWQRSTIIPFKHGDIYNTKSMRHVHKKWLNLPKRKCKQILRGILHALCNLGCIESVDMVYLKSIQFLCLKARVLCYIEQGTLLNKVIFQKDKNMEKIIRCPEISQAWEKVSAKKNIGMFVDKCTLLVPIHSVEKVNHRGIVYDLQMTNIHNYMSCDGGVVHNGGGKRKGSFSMYLEPWHADIQDFLELKKSRGSEELRARDLFYALWIPDLFMKRVKEEKMWTLFCPSVCPGLSSKWGTEFEKLYTHYEAKHPESRRIPAQDLWRQILTCCVETGGPSILFKDSCNSKSNHQHLGTIQSSNLCTEIIQYSSPDETAVCNLASICLPNFVHQKTFDFAKLRNVVHKIVENLNRVIDANFYPTEKCLRSNRRHRPIGIGVQGMADMFHSMELSWEDPQAMRVNRDVFEVIYYSALEKSCQLAEKQGVYDTFYGSPVSQGKLQFHFWPDSKPSGVDGLCQWETLLGRLGTFGCRNSLLVAPMPTASTSQIMGFSECFEPYTSNIFVRRTSAGEFKMLNRHLIKKLLSMGLWNKEVKNKIILHDGSVQWMDDAWHPDIKKVKSLYKTVWEIKHRLMIDFACERGPFIDQSQSFNVYMEDPSINKLHNAYFYSWTKGIKTCQYYLRIRTKAKAIPITLDQASSFSLNRDMQQRMDEDIVCSRENPDCATCSS